MSERPGLDLGTPRDLGPLLGEAVGLYIRHIGALLAISAAVVVPVHLIVSGIGLGELGAGYREKATTAELVIPTIASFLVIAPLVAAAVVHAVREISSARPPHAGRALSAAVDAYPAIVLALVLSAIGVLGGLALLILPGLYLLVRLQLVPQVVASEGERDARVVLRRSWDLVGGSFWRAAGVLLVGNLATLLPALLVLSPLTAVAESADSQAIVLLGTIAVEVLAAPFLAVATALLFHDLRARQTRAQT